LIQKTGSDIIPAYKNADTSCEAKTALFSLIKLSF